MSISSAVTPVRSGVKTYGDGDCWVSWWLFPRISDDQAREFIIDAGLCRDYNGPGAPFSDRGHFRHSPGHTLITQRGGYDV